MWLHVISDVLIAAAYFTIPITLFWLVRKRRDLPFNWILGRTAKPYVPEDPARRVRETLDRHPD